MYITNQYLQYSDPISYPIQSIPNPNPNPNPNPYPLSYPSYEIDPYVNASSSYCGIGGNAIAESALYHDPYAGSRTWGNWVVAQSQQSTAPVPHSAAGSFGFVAAAASSNHVQKRTRSNQVFKKSSRNEKQKPTKISPAVRCELCDADCSSLEIYAKHLSGKKHNKKLVAKYAPSQKQPQQSSKRTDARMTSLVGSNGANHTVVVHSEKVDKKAQKLVEGGASVSSVKICTLCNVVCNSEIVFADHLAGKKHTLLAGATTPTISLPVAEDANKMHPQETNYCHAPRCEVGKINCNNAKVLNSDKLGNQINCNNAEVLDSHNLGKQQQKNLEMQKNLKGNGKKNQKTSEKPKIVGTGSTVLDSTELTSEEKKDPQSSEVNGSNPKWLKKKRVQIETVEDLETKRRKVVKSGVKPDAIRTCYLCNVVCNSETVYNFHLRGRKHAAMVLQKQVEAREPAMTA